MFQIGNDTNPPILDAVLSAGVGQLQELVLTVPRGYYDSLAQEPAAIYADGYGGQVESVSKAATTVTLTAKSQAGTDVSYARLNPISSASTVSAWLNDLVSTVDGSAQFSGESAILSSVPNTASLAVGTFFDTLVQLAGSYGLEVVHTSTSAGDAFKFVNPAAVSVGEVTPLLSLAVQGSKPEYDYVGINKLAAVQYKDTITVSDDVIKYTSNNQPYLSGRWTPVATWFGRFTADDLSETDNKFNNEDDLNYTELLDNYAPLFHTFNVHSEKRRHCAREYNGERLEYNETSIIDRPYTYGIFCNAVRFGGYKKYVSNNPSGPADFITDFGRSVRFDNGNGTVNGLYQPEFLGLQLASNDNDIHPAGYVDCDNLSNIIKGKHKYETAVKEESHSVISFYNSDNELEWTEKIDVSVDISTAGESIETPQIGDFPWLLLTRDVICEEEVEDDSVTYRLGQWDNVVSITKRPTHIRVTKALFSADFDDVSHPQTIDPNPPHDISIDKYSENFFDPTASPDASHQYMGYGVVANISYALGSRYRKVELRPNCAGGSLTAFKSDGTGIQRYYIENEFDLSALSAGGPIKCVVISSADSSFTTLTGTETGEGFIMSSTVWDSKATAEACLPYIRRMQNHSVQVTAAIPLTTISSALALVSATKSLGGKAVHITGVSCDLTASLATISGYASA